MKVDGGCLCSAITYEAEIDPGKVIVCHCTDCQINGGGAFRWGVLVPAVDFTLLTGTLKSFEKTAESGRHRSLAFCGDCGTSIYGTEAEQPQNYSLRLSTARQARKLVPSAQIWHRSALDWVEDLGEIAEFATQPSLTD